LETVKISFDIETSDPTCPLGIEIWLDDTVLLVNNHVQEKITFSHDINDEDEKKHELRVIISGKTQEHTWVDEAGNIVKDSTLRISNVVIDDLDVNQLFLDKCVYTHDFNGTQSEIADTFHSTAGCNGTISFEFATPVYLWLLENM
jgi:hypothetical protein